MNTTVQRVAAIFGVVFLLVGLLGFLSTGMSMNADVNTAPRLLGLFPVNALHNVVHLLFGVWGLAASRSFGGARTYARVGGVAYLALAVLGFIAPDMFGIMPIGSHDIWLHVVLGAVLAAVGFGARAPAATTTHRV
jgi:hypothetical protein